MNKTCRQQSKRAAQSSTATCVSVACITRQVDIVSSMICGLLWLLVTLVPFLFGCPSGGRGIQACLYSGVSCQLLHAEHARAMPLLQETGSRVHRSRKVSLIYLLLYLCLVFQRGSLLITFTPIRVSGWFTVKVLLPYAYVISVQIMYGHVSLPYP